MRVEQARNECLAALREDRKTDCGIEGVAVGAGRSSGRTELHVLTDGRPDRPIRIRVSELSESLDVHIRIRPSGRLQAWSFAKTLRVKLRRRTSRGRQRTIRGHCDTDPTNGYRPAFGGLSLGHPEITAGTLGVVAKTSDGVVGLSNNHVVANSAGLDDDDVHGDPVRQPGPSDGGASKHRLGRVADYEPLQPEGFNELDAATFRPGDPDDLLARIRCIDGSPQGVVEPEVGMAVTKSGRTTEVTRGKVTGTRARVRVWYGSVPLEFRDQILVTGRDEPFSDGGDSGSAVLANRGGNPRFAGLLFAGSNPGNGDDVTVVNPPQKVVDRFDLKFPNAA